MKISQYNLNTIFATSKSTPTFYFSDPVFNVSHVKVSEVVIPNSFYVFDSKNNQFSFKEGSGATTTFSITPGNYTASTLISHLKTLLESVSENTLTYTLTYNSATAKITYAVSASTFTLLPIENNCYYELGLTNSLNSASASIESNVIDLSGVKAINLVSSSFGGNICNVVGSQYNVLCSIPVNVGFLGILFYQNSSEFIDTNLDNLYTGSFTLLDERMRPLLNTQDFQMTLLLKTV